MNVEEVRNFILQQLAPQVKGVYVKVMLVQGTAKQLLQYIRKDEPLDVTQLHNFIEF